jgi:hypothetical protein
MTVYRPRLGYRYVLRWKVDEHEPVPRRTAHDAFEQRLLEIRYSDEKRNALRAFLEEAVRLAHERILRVEPNGEDPSLHACFFAFDSSTKTLPCVTSSAPVCSLAGQNIKWGRDVIGTAYRLGSMFTLARPRLPQSAFVIEKLPQDLQYLLALPLYGHREHVPRYPSAVLALASTTSKSGMMAVVDSSYATVLAEGIYVTWREWLSRNAELIGFTPQL